MKNPLLTFSFFYGLTFYEMKIKKGTMKLNQITLFIFFLSFTILLNADDKKWSSLQGSLNWNEAKKKCSSLGMRLPSLEELKTSFDKEELSAWKKDGNTYWTASEISSDRAYYFTLLNGAKFSLAKNKSISVRCVR